MCEVLLTCKDIEKMTYTCNKQHLLEVIHTDECYRLVNYIVGLAHKLNSFVCRHVFREANFVAEKGLDLS